MLSDTSDLSHHTVGPVWSILLSCHKLGRRGGRVCVSGAVDSWDELDLELDGCLPQSTDTVRGGIDQTVLAWVASGGGMGPWLGGQPRGDMTVWIRSEGSESGQVSYAPGSLPPCGLHRSCWWWSTMSRHWHGMQRKAIWEPYLTLRVVVWPCGVVLRLLPWLQWPSAHHSTSTQDCHTGWYNQIKWIGCTYLLCPKVLAHQLPVDNQPRRVRKTPIIEYLARSRK